MTTHIVYLSDNQRICEEPARLGTDWVHSEPGSGLNPSCKECTALLFAHNQSEFEKEANERIVRREKEDPLSPAKGCIYGLLIASVFWLILGMALWVIFGH